MIMICTNIDQCIFIWMLPNQQYLLSIIYLFQFVSNYSEIMSFEKEWQRNREFDKLSATSLIVIEIPLPVGYSTLKFSS